jgi:hypothetical protein
MVSHLIWKIKEMKKLGKVTSALPTKNVKEMITLVNWTLPRDQ